MIHISQTSLLQSLGTASQFRLLHAAKTLGGGRETGRETASEADEAFTQNQESERGGVGGSERASQRESERE